MAFTHLHVHSDYSTLDGMGKIDELFATAKELGQTSLAITDHGSTSGLLRAQQAGAKYGIKPILGTEFYYERENDGNNGHLIVLAKTNKGLENIFKLQEFAFVDNFYRKPRINWDMLLKYKEDLIVSSACLASTICQYIMSGELHEATEWARKFQEVFGDDFYLEIQPNEIPEQLEVNKQILKIAKQLNIKVIATNDVHYIFEQDSFAHEVLLAMQVNKKMSDPKRFKFSTNDYWLKSEGEMFDTFNGLSDADVVSAMDNTQEIVEKCNASLIKGHYLPKYYNIPEGETERSLLAKEIMKGAKQKGFNKDKQYMSDSQNELDCIDRNGYSGYFLIVQDYVTTARKKGEPVGDGRGSGAGSKVAYLTDITRIEPSKYDLLFERFMADGREPDFDVDFADQDAVFADLQKKYGEANVARVIAFGTLTPKAVCRKVMSTFEHPASLISSINKLIPDLCPSLTDAYKTSPELLNFKEKFKLEFDVIERLESVISHESQHAGGVIIYPNLSSILPIKTKAEDRTKRIVAYDKYMLEELGHFKFDILGLETLPIIKRCLDSIYETTGNSIDLYSIDMEDSNVYEMLGKGYVSGIFQLSNQAQKVMEQQPKNFKDLIAINALIRPGTGDWIEYIARRKGKDWSVNENRLPYLQETEGLITYQEQFLLDCKTLAGWDIAFSDKYVRKNKHITDDIDLYNKFINDCNVNNVSESDAKSVWSEIIDSVAGGYSFNKSHSASYAVISYQTAWLKYYYPEHFYASIMSSEKTDGDGQANVASYIFECKNLGIKILPPDINMSKDSFVVTKDGVNYRITTIKHVGDSAIESIEKLRPIYSFEDFMERREKNTSNKNVLVNLIKAGCFDMFETNRASLLWQAEMSNRTPKQIKENHMCLHHGWDDKIKSEWEKEVLGMYLTVNPLEKYGFHPLSYFADNTPCLQGGEVYDLRVFNDKKAEKWLLFL